MVRTAALILVLLGIACVAIENLWYVETMESQLVRVNRLTGAVSRYDRQSGEWAAYRQAQSDALPSGGQTVAGPIGVVRTVGEHDWITVELSKSAKVRTGERLVVSRNAQFIARIDVLSVSGDVLSAKVLSEWKRAEPQVGDTVGAE